MKEAECLEIAERIKRDAGVRSHIPNFKPGTYGCAVPAYRLVGAPPGRTPRELYILAHECGHVRYQHVNDPDSLAVSKNELEADDFARRMLKAYGVPIDERLRLESIAMICATCIRDIERGQSPPSEVTSFLQQYPEVINLVWRNKERIPI